MSEELEQQLDQVDDSLLAEALVRLKTRSGRVSQLACLQLPAPVLDELCRRIICNASNGGGGIKAAHTWLVEQLADDAEGAPSPMAVYNFARKFLEDWRLTQLANVRSQAVSYVKACANGDPDAMQMALNLRVTELLTDEMLRAEGGGSIDTKRLMVLLMGARTVAQTAFDKQKMDARLKALQTAIEKANRDIALKQQKLDAIPARVKVVEEKLKHLQEAQKAGKAIEGAVFDAIYQELTSLRDQAA